MNQIHFFAEDLHYSPANKQLIRDWLSHAAAEEGYVIGELNFIFTSDERLLEINQQYLNHDTYTDIVTFDNSEEPAEMSSDIFISIPRARENAKKYGVPFNQELYRLLIHGVLHLAGYSDKSSDSKRRMTAKENYYLSLLE